MDIFLAFILYCMSLKRVREVSLNTGEALTVLLFYFSRYPTSLMFRLLQCCFSYLTDPHSVSFHPPVGFFYISMGEFILQHVTSHHIYLGRNSQISPCPDFPLFTSSATPVAPRTHPLSFATGIWICIYIKN